MTDSVNAGTIGRLLVNYDLHLAHIVDSAKYNCVTNISLTPGFSLRALILEISSPEKRLNLVRITT